jgi:hypothetical protein
VLVSLELELDDGVEDELDGVEDELDGVEELDEDDDGVLLEPAPAEPLGELELDGLVDDEDEEEPPLALSFFGAFTSIEVEDELEPEGAALGEAVVPLADEELGELGVAVVPLADEDDEPGDVVAPEGEVVDEELEERSAPRSHAVISDAPSARETATAIVESLMGPPWLGYGKKSKDRAASVKRPSATRQRRVSSSSSAWCRWISVRRHRRSAGNRDVGRHASDRPDPGSGWILRVSRPRWAFACSRVSWKILQLLAGQLTTCRFSATAA